MNKGWWRIFFPNSSSHQQENMSTIIKKMTTPSEPKILTLTRTEETPTYDTPYVCRDESTIRFGKHKGKPHSTLKEPKHLKYCNWLLNTEDGFADPTKLYIRNNVIS